MSKKNETKEKAASQILVDMFETIKRGVFLTLSATIDNDRRVEASERLVESEIWSHFANDEGSLVNATKADDPEAAIRRLLTDFYSRSQGLMFTIIDAAIDPARAQAAKDVAGRGIWRAQGWVLTDAVKRMAAATG